MTQQYAVDKLTPEERARFEELKRATPGFRITFHQGEVGAVNRKVATVYVRSVDDRVFVGIEITHRKWNDWMDFEPADIGWQRQATARWYDAEEFAWIFYSVKDLTKKIEEEAAAPRPHMPILDVLSKLREPFGGARRFG